VREYHQGAQQRLRRFRQGSALAVALTALLLLVWGDPVALEGQPAQPATAQSDADAVQTDAPLPLPVDPGDSVDEARRTIRELAYNIYGFLPRVVLVLAAPLARRAIEP
jgi:hypothetical protein